MAKRFNFDEAITTDIKGAASDSYIDNIKMIKVNLYHFSKIKTTRSDTKNTSPFIKSVRRKQSVLIL